MRWLLLFVPLLGCQAQQEWSGELSLLARIKERIAENLSRLPNYTCAEKIERSARSAASRKWKLVDNVRLEVAFVNGNELYGWPGANRIDESEITSLVSGTIGNGDFALITRGIFESPSTSFEFRGASDAGEQPAIRYDYRVPVSASGYHLKSGDHEAVVPYHGSFWVDPQTLDLLRLELSADGIPDHLGLVASTKILEYREARIGNSDFVLPTGATLDMVDFTGQENRNRSHFQDCRQYAGDSTLRFDNLEDRTAPVALKSVREIELPVDFEADLSLVSPLDSSASAVGDQIQLRLRGALRARNQVLAPRGAMFKARLIELHEAGNFYHVRLAFESLEFQNSHADLHARDNVISMPMKISATAHRSLRAYKPGELRTSGSLVIEADRLPLSHRFTFHLRSKLIKSQQ